MNPKIFIKKVDKNEEIWARYLLFKNDKEFEERLKKIGISNYTDDAIKSVIKLISYVRKYFEKNKVIEIILEDDVFFNAFKKDIHILNKQLLYSMESMLGDRDYILIDKSKKNRINLKMQIESTKKTSKTIISEKKEKMNKSLKYEDNQKRQKQGSQKYEKNENPEIFVEIASMNKENCWIRYSFSDAGGQKERLKKINNSDYLSIRSIMKSIVYAKKHFPENKTMTIIFKDDNLFNDFEKNIHNTPSKSLKSLICNAIEIAVNEKNYILTDGFKKSKININKKFEEIRRGEKEIHYTQNEIFQDILHFVEFEKKLIYKKAIYFTYLIKQACKYINSETINENFESFLKESSNEYLEYLKKGFNKKDLDKKIKKISNTKKGSNSNNKKDNNTLICEVFKEGCNEISGCDKSIEFLLKLISKENSSLDDDIYFVFLIRKLRKQRRAAKIRQEKILKCMQQKINNTETQKDKINLAFIEDLIINSNKRNCEFKSLVANIFNNQLSIIDQINKRHENLKYSPRILQNNLNTYVQNIA